MIEPRNLCTSSTSLAAPITRSPVSCTGFSLGTIMLKATLKNIREELNVRFKENSLVAPRNELEFRLPDKEARPAQTCILHLLGVGTAANQDSASRIRLRDILADREVPNSGEFAEPIVDLAFSGEQKPIVAIPDSIDRKSTRLN